MKYTLASFFLLLPCLVLAQYRLSGIVTDTNQQPIAYANIVLFSGDTENVYKGTITDENGYFNFEAVAEGQYLLQASFVSYQTYQAPISLSGDTQLPTIVFEETANDLDAVAITIKNPTVTRKVDRLVFDVGNTTLSSGNTWDILKNTPMVIETGGNLQVRNQPVAVYINDRKVQLSAAELKVLLENYSAENIESVEVITSPPARYEAEGGSILNIVASGSITPGYKGSINGSYTQAIYPKYQLGTSHYFKTDKLDVFANYSFSPRKEFKEDESYINYRSLSHGIESWETDFERTTRSNAHNANLILDYKLGEKRSLGFSTNMVFSPNKKSRNKDHTRITNSNLGWNEFRTRSELEEDLGNIGMDLVYREQLSDDGSQFSARAHYTRYNHSQHQFLETNFGTEITQGKLLTEAEQGIDILTAQVDLEKPLGNSWLEAGAKASHISSESTMDQESITQLPPPSQITDEFLYDEQIYAAYASLSYDWDAWSLKAGLRGEYTNREGDSRSMNQVDNYDYFELFPTLYVMNSLSENHSLAFDYSRRIQRPRYESLNPFRYYLNQYNYSSGNPDLRAAISNNFNLNYTLKGMYFFDVYYRNNGPSIEVLSFQDYQSRSLQSVSVNLLESISYGLDLSHGRSLTSFWYAYAYVSLFHEKQTFLAEVSGQEVTNEIDGVYASLFNSLSLTQDGTFSGELSLTYISDWLTGSYELDPMTTLSVGLRKTLWNNRAEVSLHLEDILNKTNTWMRSRYNNQDNGFFARPESRYVRLGFKYNFGNFRLSDNQRDLEAAERDRL